MTGSRIAPGSPSGSTMPAARASPTRADGALLASDQPASASARSAGGSSTPRDEDGEAVVFEEAVGIGEARLAQPT